MAHFLLLINPWHKTEIFKNRNQFVVWLKQNSVSQIMYRKWRLKSNDTVVSQTQFLAEKFADFKLMICGTGKHLTVTSRVD